jgi:tagaturonate reductase
LLFMKAVKEENGKYFGERNGLLYPIQDEKAAYFYTAWQSVQIYSTNSIGEFISQVLADTSLWGTNLNNLPGFAQAIAIQLSAMLQKGVKAVVEQEVHL